MTKPPTKHERTSEDQKAIEAVYAREKALPRWKVEKVDGKAKVTTDHPDQVVATVRLMEAIGTESEDFFVGIAKFRQVSVAKESTIIQ